MPDQIKTKRQARREKLDRAVADTNEALENRGVQNVTVQRLGDKLVVQKSEK